MHLVNRYRAVLLAAFAVLATLAATRAQHAVSGAAGAPSERARVLHVTPNGKAQAAGTKAEPLNFAAALAQAASRKSALRIVLAEGIYRFAQPYRLTAADSSERAPLYILAAGANAPILRGSLPVPTADFAPPRKDELPRLAASSRSSILACSIRSERLHDALATRLTGALIIDGRPYQQARFPNEGYAMLAAKPVHAEISPPAVPVGEQDYGVRAGHPPYQEAGRRQGWLGSIEEPRGAHARIAQRANEMAGTFQQWQDELTRNNRRNLLSGFLDANWLQRSQPLVSANAETRSLQLSQALAYGWAWRNRDKPFRVTGLLCELDAPGEWHYDPMTRRLFVRPPAETLPADTLMELPVADGFLRLDGANHVTIRGLSIEHLRAGTAVHLAGNHNRLESCTIRNCSALAVRISGQHERVAGCDIVDCHGHIVLSGGRREPQRITPGDNVVDNCHCYQDRFTHHRVSVGISGVGNTLRNCLVHNSIGQAVTVRGNDHLLTQNEFCNIGYEEGDGGAVYAGGDLSGYGVIYRHNFFHHLMHVPGKVERSGLHLDDLQAGSQCVGNIFYKSAAKGIFMNGGAGHTIRNNLFLNGFRGAYNVGHNADKAYRLQLAIDRNPSHEHRNTKENYVGRVERIVGSAGWRNEPWRSRYPRFFEVMQDDGPFGRMWPIRCEVSGNLYFDTDKGDRTIWSRVAPKALAKSRIGPDGIISPDVFVDYDALDLRFVDADGDLPDIPFASIGLRLDEHRGAMPDKAHLRRTLREHFRGIGSMPGTTRRLDTAAVVQTGPLRRRAH